MVKDTKSHGADQLAVQLVGQGLEGTSLYWQEPMMAEDARQAVDIQYIAQCCTFWTVKIVGVLGFGFALTGMVENSKQKVLFCMAQDQSVFDLYIRPSDELSKCFILFVCYLVSIFKCHFSKWNDLPKINM